MFKDLRAKIEHEQNHHECRLQSARMQLQIDKLESDKETLNGDLESIRLKLDEQIEKTQNLLDEIDKLRSLSAPPKNSDDQNHNEIIQSTSETLNKKDECVQTEIRPETCDQQTQSELNIDIDIPPLQDVAALKLQHEQQQKTVQELDALRKQIEYLTIDLSERDKIIRLKQQNLNDLKKTLRKEMSDNRRQNSTGASNLSNLNSYDTTSSLNHVSHRLEGGAQRLYSNSNGNGIGGKHSPTPSHNSHSRGSLVGGAICGTSSPQFDQHHNQFTRSRSSASMSTEIENHLSGAVCSAADPAPVNYEYLRNVLFRYMSNTKCESDQHLVKAISVLMNFSPEQCAAIKSAMHWRSSWLNRSTWVQLGLGSSNSNSTSTTNDHH